VIRRLRRHTERLEALERAMVNTHTEFRCAFNGLQAVCEDRSRAEREILVQLPVALVRAVRDVRRHVTTHDHALARALERIAVACRVLAIRHDAERREHEALLSAIDGLVGVLTTRMPPPTNGARRASVVGGSVHPGQPGECALPTECCPSDPSGTGPLRREPSRVLLDGVEVRCRFDSDHWVGGFEVCDAVAHADRVQYQLRRTSDRAVLPTLFAETDVRAVSR
jgi:hypothetical protein